MENIRKKILVVDETSSILKIISFILSNEYEVVTKSNGIEALNWLELGFLPQLIIASLNLPTYIGQSFVHIIKGNSPVYDIPVLLTTVADDADAVMASLPFPINGCIKKPFNPNELKTAVKQLL